MKNIFLIYAILLVLFQGGCSQRKVGYNKTEYTSAARHKATMKSYKVMGKRYHPCYVKKGQVQHGVSSWYGPNFHGKYTSNGEVYNMHARTAAHKTWPMDTMVKVSNLENGKSTIVRINDRGPFVKGRIIDCSYTAGKEIGLDKMGIAKVKVEVLGLAGKINSPKNNRNKIKKQKPSIDIKISNYGIQVGAFSEVLGAKNYQKFYRKKYFTYNTIIKKIYNDEGIMLYGVWLMGFNSEQEARNFKENNDLFGAPIVSNDKNEDVNNG